MSSISISFAYREMFYMRWSLSIIFMCTTSYLCATENQFRHTQDGVTLIATVIPPDKPIVNTEMWKLQARDFIKHGYQPVQITLINHSDTVVTISNQSIQLQNFDPNQLTQLLQFRQNVQPLAGLIGGYMLCSILAAISLSCILDDGASGKTIGLNHFIGLGASLIGYIGVTIWSICYRWKLSAANTNLATILAQSLLIHPMSVPENNPTETILLIPTHYSEPLPFTIFNEDNSRIVTKFDIHWDQN